MKTNKSVVDQRIRINNIILEDRDTGEKHNVSMINVLYSVYKEQWVYAAVFGVMETGWYFGNIVSGYQEAEIYNQNEENKFKLKLSLSFPVEFKIFKN